MPCSYKTKWIPWRFVGVIQKSVDYRPIPYNNSMPHRRLTWGQRWTRDRHQFKVYQRQVHIRGESVIVKAKMQYGSITRVKYTPIAGCAGRRVIYGSDGLAPWKSPVVNTYCTDPG
jgi:hypothetical protein